MRRYAFSRKDKNHKAISKAFEDLGCRVVDINDHFDILVQLGRICVMVEIKREDVARKPKKGRQADFHLKYRVEFVQSVDDALALVKRLRLAWAACADAFRAEPETVCAPGRQGAETCAT